MLHPKTRFTRDADVATSTNPVATALQIVRAMRRNVTARAYGRIDARTFAQRVDRLWREAEVAGDEVYQLVSERADLAA